MQKTAATTRRGFLKTVAVGAGGYAVGSLLIDPKVVLAQSIEGNLEKIPMETRWAIASGSFLYVQSGENKALLDKVGQEEYNAIKKKSGLTIGAANKARAEGFGFTGTDPKSVAAMTTALITVYYGPKQKFEIVDASSAEKASVKCINCAYWDTLQARKITGDTCSAFSQYWWEGFVTAVNPNLNLQLVKARPLGDAICEWNIVNKA